MLPGTATPEARSVLRALARDEILHPENYQSVLTPDAAAALQAIAHPKPPGVNMTAAEFQAAALILNPVVDLSKFISEQQTALAAILNPKKDGPGSAPTGRWFFETDESQIPPMPTESDPLVFPVPVDNSSIPSSVGR
jgi:hypothetical protein